jgi:hypothetical protein
METMNYTPNHHQVVEQQQPNVSHPEILNIPNVQDQHNTNQVDPLVSQLGDPQIQYASSELINNEFTRTKMQYKDPNKDEQHNELKLNIEAYLTCESFKEKLYRLYETEIPHIDYYTIEELEKLLSKFERACDQSIIKGSSKQLFNVGMSAYETACVTSGLKVKGIADQLKKENGIDLLMDSILLKRRVRMSPEIQLGLLIVGATADLHYKNDINDHINDAKEEIKPKIEKMKDINVSDNIMMKGSDL